MFMFYAFDINTYVHPYIYVYLLYNVVGMRGYKEWVLFWKEGVVLGASVNNNINVGFSYENSHS